MEPKSMLDTAYMLVSKKKRPIEFSKLWKEVQEMLGIDKENFKVMAELYTQLILDGRFVNLGDNVWDLRSRQTYDKVHIDMNDAYTDEDEDEVEEYLEEAKDGDLDSASDDFIEEDFDESDDDYNE